MPFKHRFTVTKEKVWLFIYIIIYNPKFRGALLMFDLIPTFEYIWYIIFRDVKPPAVESQVPVLPSGDIPSRTPDQFHFLCVTVPVVQIEKAWQFSYNQIWCAQLTITGWWFGTVFIFHDIWDNPSHWLIFFRGVETTNQISYPAFFRCVPHVDESLAISMDGATKRTALLMYKLDLSTMGRWPTEKQVQRISEVSSIVLNWTSYNNFRYTRVVSCPMDTIEYIVPINQI